MRMWPRIQRGKCWPRFESSFLQEAEIQVGLCNMAHPILNPHGVLVVRTPVRLRRMLFLTLLMSMFVSAAPLSEQQKIDALIHSVEVLPGAQFIRNGSAHDGKAAADHLQMKRSYAGKRIKTANDFIECCASRSSMSGRPYQIRFANGKTVDAGVFFHAELKRIESPPVVTMPAAATAAHH